ncbi:hypothetical protein [Halorussus ruber]|uniref:hypothetical protein n=1 Tax=Halorussus ruber TaxID=1126238 RepID=UPI0010929CB7|nr:hypothetical protein [Halorussus ruber]
MVENQQEKGAEEGAKSTRREVLRAVGASGTGVLAIQHGLQGVRAGGDDVKIVTHKSRNTVARTQRVSKQWYDHKTQAKQALNRLRQNLGASPNVLGISTETLDERIDGLRKFGIRVSFDEAEGSLPVASEVNGIPVLTEEIPGFDRACYTGYQEPIKGGNGHTSPSGAATLTCRVYKGGQKFMMGCRHVFVDNDKGNCDGSDITGTKWSQGGDEVGKVVYGYQNHDCTLLDKSTDGNRVFDNSIVDETGYVAGRVTAEGVDYLASSNDTVRKRGRSSCKEQGEVVGTGTIYCNNGNYVGNAVRHTAHIESGDSGGPSYHKISKSNSSDELYMLNINTHSKSITGDDTWGSAAFAMHNKRDISFGGATFSG